MADNASMFKELEQDVKLESTRLKEVDGVLEPRVVELATCPHGYFTCDGMWLYPTNGTPVGAIHGPDRDESRFGTIPFQVGAAVCRTGSSDKGVILSKKWSQTQMEYYYSVQSTTGNKLVFLKDCHYPVSNLRLWCETDRKIPMHSFFRKRKAGGKSVVNNRTFKTNGWVEDDLRKLESCHGIMYNDQPYLVMCNDKLHNGVWCIPCNKETMTPLEKTDYIYGESDACLIYYEHIDAFSPSFDYVLNRYGFLNDSREIEHEEVISMSTNQSFDDNRPTMDRVETETAAEAEKFDVATVFTWLKSNERNLFEQRQSIDKLQNSTKMHLGEISVALSALKKSIVALMMQKNAKSQRFAISGASSSDRLERARLFELHRDVLFPETRSDICRHPFDYEKDPAFDKAPFIMYYNELKRKSKHISIFRDDEIMNWRPTCTMLELISRST